MTASDVIFLDINRFKAMVANYLWIQDLALDSGGYWGKPSDISLENGDPLRMSLLYDDYGVGGESNPLDLTAETVTLITPLGMISDQDGFSETVPFTNSDPIEIELNHALEKETVQLFAPEGEPPYVEITSSDIIGATLRPLFALPDGLTFDSKDQWLSEGQEHVVYQLSVAELAAIEDGSNTLWVNSYTGGVETNPDRAPIAINEIGQTVELNGGRGEATLTETGQLVYTMTDPNRTDNQILHWQQPASEAPSQVGYSRTTFTGLHDDYQFDVGSGTPDFFASSTEDIKAVSLSSKWRATNANTADVPDKMDNIDNRFGDSFGEYQNERGQYLDALTKYSPEVNTIRIDINGKSILDDVFKQTLTEISGAGFKLILNYADPLLGNYVLDDGIRNGTNFSPTANDNQGEPIEILLDDDVVVFVDGTGYKTKAQENWGSGSDEFDPIDDLTSGWQEILDWVNSAENSAVLGAVYGYEMLNEPLSYDGSSSAQARWYADDMVDVYANVTGWGDKKILVDGMGIANKFDALAFDNQGIGETPLQTIQNTFGDKLVWSVHHYETGDGNQDALKQKMINIIAVLADDDILITEMNYDADYADPNDPNADTTSLNDEDGDAPSWAYWSLLDPIAGPQASKYAYARVSEFFAENGIGTTWWSPSNIDGNLMTEVDDVPQEERDSLAFALNMWNGSDDAAVDGSGSGNDTIQISDALISIGNDIADNAAPRVAFGFDGDDIITGTDNIASEGLLRYNDTPNIRDGDGNLIPNRDIQNFDGDKAYGGAGNDSINLLGGDDFGFGNDGDDMINGGTGHDVLLGGRGKDTLDGGTGDDVLEGQDGDDIIDAGAGRDLIRGDHGSDTLSGGADGDHFYFLNGDGSDYILDFAASEDKLYIDDVEVDLLNLGANMTITSDADGINVLHYGDGDQIRFGARPLDGIVSGTDGNDIIDASYVDSTDGDVINDLGQTINTGTGYDNVYDGAGNDTINFGENGTLINGAGNDIVTIERSGQVVDGAGIDTYYGGTYKSNFYVTEAGDNYFYLGSHHDGVYFDTDALTEGLTIDLRDPSQSTGIAKDNHIIAHETGAGHVTGTRFDDVIHNNGMAYVNGGDGDDVIYDYADGGFKLNGGAGDDRFVFTEIDDQYLWINGFAQGADAASGDKIDLSHLGIQSINELSITGTGNMVIDYAGDQIRVQGINFLDDANIQLLGSDFIFAPTTDGIVSGTDGNDIIDASYVDSTDGDVINDLGQTINTGTGYDNVYDGAGNDTINFGENGTLINGAGNDIVTIERSGQVVDGAGIDTYYGGTYKSNFYVTEAGDNYFYLGSHHDGVYFDTDALTEGLTIDLRDPSQSTGIAKDNHIIAHETGAGHVTGTRFDDVIHNNGMAYVNGGDGDDVIYDYADGGFKLNGGAGDDRFVFTEIDDQYLWINGFAQGADAASGDKIDLSHLGIQSINELSITGTGNMVIDYAGDQIRVQGINFLDDTNQTLNAYDFIFA